MQLLGVSGYPSLLNQTQLDSNGHKYTRCVEFGSEHKGPLGASASCNYPETPSMFTSVFIEVSACPLQYSHCSHSVMSPYNRKNMPGHGLVVSVFFSLFPAQTNLFKAISTVKYLSFPFFFVFDSSQWEPLLSPLGCGLLGLMCLIVSVCDCVSVYASY